MRQLHTSVIFRILIISGLSACILLASTIAGCRYWRSRRYLKQVVESGRAYGIDPLFILAVIRRESGFNPRAVGKAGEKGLMQVTEAAAGEWAAAVGIQSFTPDDLFKPDINIQAGTWYLARAIRRWSEKADPLPYALAEYNAGRSNATRWAANDEGDPEKFRASITYPGTRRYIDDILGDYRARSGAASNCISYRRR